MVPNQAEQSPGSVWRAVVRPEDSVILASHSKKLLTLSGRQRGDIEVFEVRRWYNICVFKRSPQLHSGGRKIE